MRSAVPPIVNSGLVTHGTGSSAVLMIQPNAGKLINMTGQGSPQGSPRDAEMAHYSPPAPVPGKIFSPRDGAVSAGDFRIPKRASDGGRSPQRLSKAAKAKAGKSASPDHRVHRRSRNQVQMTNSQPMRVDDENSRTPQQVGGQIAHIQVGGQIKKIFLDDAVLDKVLEASPQTQAPLVTKTKHHSSGKKSTLSPDGKKSANTVHLHKKSKKFSAVQEAEKLAVAKSWNPHHHYHRSFENEPLALPPAPLMPNLEQRGPKVNFRDRENGEVTAPEPCQIMMKSPPSSIKKKKSTRQTNARAQVASAQAFQSFSPVPDDHPDAIHYFRESKDDAPVPRAKALPVNEDAGLIGRPGTLGKRTAANATRRMAATGVPFAPKKSTTLESLPKRRVKCQPKMVARFNIAPEQSLLIAQAQKVREDKNKTTATPSFNNMNMMSNAATATASSRPQSQQRPQPGLRANMGCAVDIFPVGMKATKYVRRDEAVNSRRPKLWTSQRDNRTPYEMSPPRLADRENEMPPALASDGMPKTVSAVAARDHEDPSVAVNVTASAFEHQVQEQRNVFRNDDYLL